MTSASGSTRMSKKDDVEALLSDLDRLNTNVSTPPPAPRQAGSVGYDSARSTPSAGGPTARAAGGTASAKSKDDAQSLLADLDDLVKQRRVPTPKRTVTGSLTGSVQSSRASSSLQTPGGSGTATPVSLSGARNKHLKDAPLPVPTDTLSADGGASVAFAAASSEPLASSSQYQTNESSGLADGSLASTATASSASQQQQGSWGSWWNSATKLADQARAELEKRAAQVQTQVAETTKAAAAAAAAASSSQDGEHGRASEDGVAGGGGATAAPWQLAQNVNAFLKSHGAGDLNKLRSDIGKVGMKRWNEILNVVVPPIESHEVLSITLSHDMLGFDGVPDVVFQVLQRQMETHASSQNAEQQIVVNKSRAADVKVGPSEGDAGAANENGASVTPDMRPIVGFAEAWKLAEKRLDELIAAQGPLPEKSQRADESDGGGGVSLPITTCPLFIRIQPVLDFLPGVTPTTPSRTLTSENATHLYIALTLRDPTNKISHRTISQPLLKSYALLPFEQHPWAEDLLSESLQGSLSNLGLEYVRSRMQAQSEALSQAAANVEGGRSSLEA